MHRNDLTPVELKAIEEHKYFMSRAAGRPVSIDEAIADFVAKYRADWLREKTRHDNLAQMSEIERHKYFASERAGRDLGEQAVEKWLQEFAGIWRRERESLEHNGFLRRTLTIENERGLHVRPSGTLVGIAKEFDCDIYVHKAGMDHYNFLLHGKPFLNVRSVLVATLDLVGLCAGQGDELEFIAYGRQAADALDRIEQVIKTKFGEER
ncbi:MAG TPA: HPr family phosphocarrier protein [Opitutaceae bacterium]|nr:HPr family phosphocarrier protein [Opitutaceae bacterium]